MRAVDALTGVLLALKPQWLLDRPSECHRLPEIKWECVRECAGCPYMCQSYCYSLLPSQLAMLCLESS